MLICLQIKQCLYLNTDSVLIYFLPKLLSIQELSTFYKAYIRRLCCLFFYQSIEETLFLSFFFRSTAVIIYTFKSTYLYICNLLNFSFSMNMIFRVFSACLNTEYFCSSWGLYKTLIFFYVGNTYMYYIPLTSSYVEILSSITYV